MRRPLVRVLVRMTHEQRTANHTKNPFAMRANHGARCAARNNDLSQNAAAAARTRAPSGDRPPSVGGGDWRTSEAPIGFTCVGPGPAEAARAAPRPPTRPPADA